LSGSWDGTMRLWSASTGKLLQTFAAQNQVYSVAFSPDGGRLLSGSGASIKLWDVSTGSLVHTFRGYAHQISSAAFSPDGTRMVAGTTGKAIQLWNIE